MGANDDASTVDTSNTEAIPEVLLPHSPSAASKTHPTAAVHDPPRTCCTFCGETFASRSALFRHFRGEADGCSAPRLDPGEKVMLLFGYDCCLSNAVPGGAEAGSDDGASSLHVADGDSAGERILAAMGVSGFEERRAGVKGAGAKPVGFSQASSVGSRRCPLLVQEPGVSATADTMCLKAPTTVPTSKIRAWLEETNAALAGSGVRVLGRMPVPKELHAEAHATRRRYEYLIPAWLLDETAEGPWGGGARGETTLIPLLRGVRTRSFRPFGSCNARLDGGRRRRRCPLWHNFSASALPRSASASRRLYRFYSHSTVTIRDVDYVCLSMSGDAFVDQQVRGMVALAVAAARGLIDAEEISACIDPTRQEDIFPVPLAPLPPCWLAEVSYSTWQSKLGGVCMSPAAAKRLAHPLDGWSDDHTRAAGSVFRQTVQESAASWWETQKNLGAEWLHGVLQPGAARLRTELAAANERVKAAAADGSDEDPDSAGIVRKKLSASEMQSLSATPPIYTKILRLLREADASGLWPASTPARDSVIFGGAVKKKAPSAKSYLKKALLSEGRTIGGARDSPNKDDEQYNSDIGEDICDTSGDESGEQDQEEDTFEGGSNDGVVDNDGSELYQHNQQQQSPSPAPAPHGGSFTVGSFPPPCPQPRGNAIFPELTRAAFELESILLPNRPASTTIAINRHAQFRPHIDSGTGAGQSLSLIVGLGNYVGGQLVVEGEEVDIRYRPREFNGWTQRHWTRPFRGERFSLVWFTPKGCEEFAKADCIFPGGPMRRRVGIDGSGGGSPPDDGLDGGSEGDLLLRQAEDSR